MANLYEQLGRLHEKHDNLSDQYADLCRTLVQIKQGQLSIDRLELVVTDSTISWSVLPELKAVQPDAERIAAAKDGEAVTLTVTA